MPPPSARSRAATVTLVGLLGFAIGSLATLVLDYVLLGVVILPALVVAVVLLGAAGLVANGRRWAPAVGAVVAGALLVGTFTEGVGYQRLTAPENVWLFAPTVLMVLGAVAAVLAGAAASWRAATDRRAARPQRRR